MSSKKHTTWDAKPHTIAKIQILQGYLVPYFQILGRSNPGEEIIYVDGFAGPGKYKNNLAGSPIAALKAAAIVLANAGDQFRAKGITCIFVEKNKRRFKSLVHAIEPFNRVPRLTIVPINKSFTDAAELIRSKFPSAFKGGPAFFFVDPFGVSQTPMSLIHKILDNPKSEIFINFNAPGMNRIILAGENANANSLAAEVVGPADWNRLLGSQKNSERARLIFQAYQKNVRAIPGVHYVFPFEMRNNSDLIEYFLLFAGHHHLGLEKMKEAMKSIAGNSSYIFSDAHQGFQGEMFTDNALPRYSDMLHLQFAGKEAIFGTLRDFALNETPFTNPKGMLRYLEKRDLLLVQLVPGAKRRRGDFAEEKIGSIKFKEYEGNLFN